MNRQLKEEVVLVKRRTGIVVAVLASAVVGLTACGPANPREQQGAAVGATAGGAKNTVRLGLLGIMSDAPIVMADKHGYFKKFGVSVKIQNFDSGGDMVAPMSTGQLDVGGGAFSAGLMNSIADGNGMQIVADKGAFPSPKLGSQQFILAKKYTGKIKSLSDLKGHKIAIGTAEGTAPYVSVMDALKKAGIADPEHTTTSMKSSDVVVALQQGAADAAWVSEPNAAMAIKQGVAVAWKSAYDIAPKEQDATIFYGTDWAKKNPQLAQNFMNAYVCGVNDYLGAVAAGGQELAEAEQAIASYTDTDVKTVESAHLPGYFKNGVPDVKSIEHTMSLFVDSGESPKAVPISEMVNLDYVHKAAKVSCK